MKKLGKNQEGVLGCLKRHNGFRGFGIGCGWYWNTRTGTIKICESLVKRGFAELKDDRYYITDAGNQYIKDNDIHY